MASSTGSSSPARVPVLLVAVMDPTTIVIICNLVAAIPGWAPARIPPAVVMRSD